MKDIIDQLFELISPDDIPRNYIKMLKIRTFSGEEKIYTGIEMRDVLANPEEHEIASAQAIFDIRRMRRDMSEAANEIFAEAKAITRQGPSDRV
jgi:hypothetical protein